MRYTVTMPSPFPGMDPYLEGRHWPDVHHALAAAIRHELAATIPARYVIRVETSVISDESGSDPLAIMYPDLHIHHPDAAGATDVDSNVALLPPRISVPAPVLARVHSITIRLAPEGTLVTSIEILSSANKYGESFQKFSEKWHRLRRASVNLVEIDLIRRGRRIFPQPELRDAPYLVTVTPRSGASTGAWPITLREPLPEVPVPLAEPDPDARLALQELFAGIYLDGRYDLDIKYGVESPPPPPLSAADAAWVSALFTPVNG